MRILAAGLIVATSTLATAPRAAGQAASLRATAQVLPATASRQGLALADSITSASVSDGWRPRSGCWVEVRLEPLPTSAGGWPRRVLTISFLRN